MGDWKNIGSVLPSFFLFFLFGFITSWESFHTGSGIFQLSSSAIFIFCLKEIKMAGNVRVIANDSEFDPEQTNAGTKLVVVDFFATW